MQRSSERGPRSLIWDLEIGVVPLGRWDGTHQPDDTAMEGIVGWSFPVRQCIGYAGDACFVLFLIPPKYRPKYSISSASVCLGKSCFGDVEPLPAPAARLSFNLKSFVRRRTNYRNHLVGDTEAGLVLSVFVSEEKRLRRKPRLDCCPQYGVPAPSW